MKQIESIVGALVRLLIYWLEGRRRKGGGDAED